MHEEYDFLQDRVNKLKEELEELQGEYDLLRDRYNELAEKYGFFLEGLPKPYTYDGKRATYRYKLRNWEKRLVETFAKVEKEIAKLGNLNRYDIEYINQKRHGEDVAGLTEKLTDLITVTTSTLEWLGLSQWGRCKKQGEVNKKNKQLGFIE